MSETDLELLARYARHHTEDAFAELVRRHLGLVYSAALRQVRSPQLAEEVAQCTFIDLARQAANLKPDTILTAWLYQITRRTANAVEAAPVGLAVAISTAATLAGTSIATTATVAIKKAIGMTILKKALLRGALVVAVTTPIYLQQRAKESLRAENAALRVQTTELATLAQLKAENERLAKQLKIEAERPQAERRELLQLRGRVGMLRQAAQENPRLRTELNDLAKKLQQIDAERGGGVENDPQKKMMINKVQFATLWGHALLKAGQRNGGQIPPDLATAAPYLKDNELLPINWRNTDPIIGEAATNGIGIDRFELVYQGSLTNLVDPSRTILMREKESFRAADGRWTRIYVYANGFGSTRWSDDGNFKDVESAGAPQRISP